MTNIFYQPVFWFALLPAGIMMWIGVIVIISIAISFCKDMFR